MKHIRATRPLLLFFLFACYSVQAQQQVISFPDATVRAAVLAQYGEGTTGLNNGATQINSTSIDFSKLFSISDPLNQGVNGVTNLIIYSENYVPGTLAGVELLPGLSYLAANGYNGLQIPAGIVNLPLKTLDLSMNGNIILPVSFNSLTNMESLNISQNGLTSLPALPSNLTHLAVDRNQLSFQDLEPYAAFFSSPSDYADQLNFILSPGVINLNAGETLNATAAGYVGGSSNLYHWFRDGEAVTQATTDPAFIISAVLAGDAGAYSCQVTSTLLPGLVISSGNITVSVAPSLLLASDQLWGMTSRTGTTTGGNVFKIDASTNAFATVKQLTSTDGTFPHGDLMQASDGFLYGMTYLDGANNMGTIFRIYKDGTQFQKVYDFENTLGSHPKGTLVEAADGNLYGMTERGPGEILTGTVFRINKGLVPNYTHLYEFGFQALPLGNLIQADDGDLYGLTQTGAVGGANMGSIFKIKTDGSGFKVLHQFNETKLEGHQPNGSLLQASNGSLYGMTVHGGESVEGDGGGALFRMDKDGRNFKILLKMFDGPKGNLIQGANGSLYGMAEGGSFTLYGYIFKTDLNGTDLQTLHVFDELNGAYPSGSLTETPNGEMYGMTQRGGANDKGVLFKIRPDGSNFTKLYDFDVTGYAPTGSLFFLRKINQTIIFAHIPDKEIIDGPFPLAVSTTSGLAVTLTSSDPTVASISGNIVTLNAIGTTTITASQSGDTDFDAAKSVSRVLTVTKIKQNQTITFDPLAVKVGNDADFPLTAYSDSGLSVSYSSSDESVAEVYGTTVVITGSGTCIITASQPGNDDYFGAEEVTQQLIINKADQLITFDALPAKAKNSPPFTLYASSSSQLPIAYTSSDLAVATISGNAVTIIGAGTTTITATQGGNNIFLPAAIAQQELAISKADQTITFGPIVIPTGGNGTFALPAFSDSDLPITYSSSNESVAVISGDMLTVIGNGSVTITANQAGNKDYFPAGMAQQELVISRQDQFITFDALPVRNIKTISFALNAITSSKLPAAYTSSNPDVATVSGRKVTVVGIGSTIITASQPGNGFFNPAPVVEQQLIISKADQIITFSAIDSKTMEDKSFVVDATSDSFLDVTFTSDDNEIAISGSIVTILKPGFVTIAAHQQGSNDVNQAEVVTQSFCITPDTPAITTLLTNAGEPILTSSSTINNQWYFNGVSIAGETGNTYVVEDEGQFSVRVIAESCSSIMSELTTVLVTNVKDEPIPAILNLYPNPAIGSFTLSIELPIDQLAYVSIYNSSGKLMQSGGSELLNRAIAIDQYTPGLYLASIDIGGKVISKKFIKK